MILSEIYQMHDRLCAVVLDPESGTITPIRVVNLDTKELTPQFFSDARAGFPDAKPFRPYNPNSLNWLIIEKYGLLVASINNLGGFIVFESPDMIPLARSLFSKKARLNYERRFPARETCKRFQCPDSSWRYSSLPCRGFQEHSGSLRWFEWLFLLQKDPHI